MKKKGMIAFLLLLSLLLIGCASKTTTASTTAATTEAPTTAAPTTTEEPTTTIEEFADWTISFSSPSTELIKGKEGCESVSTSIEVSLNDEVVSDLDIAYSSSDKTVATVDDNGVVTAAGKGTAIITAAFESKGETHNVAMKFTVYEIISSTDVSTFADGMVNKFGRVYMTGDYATLDNPATAVEVYFYGTNLSINEKGSSASLYFRVFIDDDEEGVMTNVKSTNFGNIVIASDLDEGIHKVRVVKCSSPDAGKILISSFTTDGEFLSAKEKSDLKIEFIGDSITVGFGDLGTSSEAQSTANSDTTKAYAYLTAQMLDADYSIIALEGICTTNSTYNMVTYYEDYSTTNKTEYNPSDFDADIVVLALGENDMWHATSSSFDYTVDEFIADYAAFMQTVRKFHPNAYIICIYGMMPAYATSEAKTALQTAITNSGLTNIKMLQMATNSAGSGSHPNQKAQKGYAKKIVNDITNNYLANLE